MLRLSPSTGRGSALPADDIVRSLAEGGPAVVALSGGVDSAVVAHLAYAALGPRAHALTLAGPAVSADERERASRVARAIGVPHEFLRSDPLEVAEYRANPDNRCYFCRKTESSALLGWGRGRGIAQWLDGVHADDLGEDRPGLAAMDEAGFRHPLAAAGWRKSDVREYARRVGLPNWNAPSDACLASRVTHGREISGPLLARIETAEAAVRALGFRRVRVRTDGASARVEVDATEVARLENSDVAASVDRAVRALGFGPVTLDPHGYRPRPGA
ncbi:MAG: ATP-dependent sacrificial sulfur transferase LarE [Thermoplasmata archaeon]|nr:ATP-dependent sacrificial sulfur transferase LarE [Thermoplasmata archaeon]MCI4355023.1 ATP-dependent sacrificial sulfur transferase LarE [Thermoplasmata archaeon]